MEELRSEGDYERAQHVLFRCPEDILPSRPTAARGRRLAEAEHAVWKTVSPEQRLLVLNFWKRSGLPAGGFGELVGHSAHSLYQWRKRFQEYGLGGLMDKPRGAPAGSRLPDLTCRTLLMLKAENPAWGCQRISDMLVRGPALGASPGAEILTDNDARYVTRRGKSAFSKELEKRGIRQIVARPRHPQTLGKIEPFWESLWRECLETAVFIDLADAQRRIGLFMDQYNFQRPHQGIGSLVPADRYSCAAPEVVRSMKERVAANALELARSGLPRAPSYLTGQAGGRSFSVHAEGERVFLRQAQGERRVVELVSPEAEGSGGEPEPTLPPPVCPDGSPSGSDAGLRRARPRHLASGRVPRAAPGPAGEEGGG